MSLGRGGDLLAVFSLPLQKSKSQPKPDIDVLIQAIAEEDVQAKAEAAHAKLAAYVREHGLELPDGWRTIIKPRLTTRRNGKIGRTTNNEYYSPTGQNYRSFAKVLEAVRRSAAASSGEAHVAPGGCLSSSPASPASPTLG